jgi:hypothetical protein
LQNEIDILKTLLPEKVIDSAYKDMLSSPAKEVGKLATDIVKTARLFLAPFQLAAAFQDRFEHMMERISKRVSEDRRISPPAEISGPALEQMRYLDEDNPLWQMFEELLYQSVDETGIGKVHPSFSYIISQLSRDEAIIIYRLKESSFEVVDVMDLNEQENRFENRKIEQSNLPMVDLYLPDKIDLYYSHLESLNLVLWLVDKQDPINDDAGKQLGIRRWSTMHLTEFGRLFADICIPEHGFMKLSAGGRS